MNDRVKHPIEIVPYSSRWPEEFREIGAAIRDAMGERALRIDHIGSTSVPGLAAKDVIDIQLTVEELDAPSIAAALATVGYSPHEGIVHDHVPPGMDDDPGEWRKLYFAPPTGQRRTHLHVRQQGRANQRYALLFRDYLRANPPAATTYRLIKEELACLHPHDADAYYAIKDPVCDLIIQAAERWTIATDYAPDPSDL